MLEFLGQDKGLLWVCAVLRRRSSVGASPTRQLSLQPEATGAVMEVTKWLKPLVTGLAACPMSRDISKLPIAPKPHQGYSRCQDPKAISVGVFSVPVPSPLSSPRN